MHESSVNATGTALQPLPKLLALIENGEIRIPSFQRDFLWPKPKIVDLLNSILQGYPIGSLLLLHTSSKSLSANLSTTPFPKSKVNYPAYFIIDGVQRLSTLYGTLVASIEQNADNKFKVLLDLQDMKFKHASKKKIEFWEVSSFTLYSKHDQYFEVQERLVGERKLLKNYMSAFQIFQDFKIPVVTIEDRSLEEIIDIFIKINNQGVKLSKADKERALDWILHH